MDHLKLPAPSYQTSPYFSIIRLFKEDPPAYGPDTLDPTFIREIREMLRQARQKAYSAVNFVMVETYWQIGRRIVEEELHGKDRADYGSFLIRELSKKLSAEFGKGFALANIKNFRPFYLTFPDIEKGYALRSELTWTHYRLIMRVESPAAREYYIREAAEQNWSTRQLERNIQSHYYERLLRKPGNAELSNAETQTTADFIKDPYVLEFLNIPETTTYSEKGPETALIENLQLFLLELCKGFSFVGRQFRISTVGIILCEAKDETVARYSVLHGSEQLFASKYRLVLPTEEELAAGLMRERRLLNEKNQKT